MVQSEQLFHFPPPPSQDGSTNHWPEICTVFAASAHTGAVIPRLFQRVTQSLTSAPPALPTRPCWLDDLRIYDRGLGPEDIAALHARPVDLP
jgi:hypothetical protein